MEAHMPTLTRLSSGLALLCGSLIWALPSFPAGAASITTQKRCTIGPSGACLWFRTNDTIPVIRSIRFTAPKAGTAQVTFHGSLFCGGWTTVPPGGSAMSILRFVSQIVDKSNEVPDDNKAGSLTHS
jgi:hypothetical protein